jgi:carbon starvation protein
MQDLLGTAVPALKDTNNHFASLLATGLVVAAWGYFLYQGVLDPFGGINTLWALFGIANQMLAGIALILATVALVRMGRTRFSWVTGIPAAWVLLITLMAGWQKLFSDNPKIGFLAHAQKYADAFARGEVLAPAKDLAQMQSVILNDRIDAVMAAFFILVVLAMLGFATVAIRRALNKPQQDNAEVIVAGRSI